jgi:hypothetical protein
LGRCASSAIERSPLALAAQGNVSRVKHRQIRDFLEIILFVEGENIGDPIVFHDYAMNHVAHPGMILKNPLSLT